MKSTQSRRGIKEMIKKMIQHLSGRKIELNMLDVFHWGTQQIYNEAYFEYREVTLRISGANPICWFTICTDEITGIKEFQITRYEITLSGGRSVTISDFY